MTVFFTLANKNQPDIILLRLKASQSVLETLLGGTTFKVANALLTSACSW